MFEQMSDDQLHEANIRVARTEREAATLMIKHLAETKRRHLYSKFACASLYEYCTKHLKMSNGDAWRKLGSAQLIEKQPEIEMKLTTGELSPTNLAEAAALFKREDTPATEQKEILREIENKSTLEARKVIWEKSKKPEELRREQTKRESPHVTQVTLYLDDETMQDLERLREIWSHAIPHGKLSEIIKRLAKVAREKEDSKKAPAPGTKARIKYDVAKRDENQCTYRDPETKERCTSRHFLEEDHIIPKAMGGEYTTDNIRLRCRTHNQRHAINTYGLHKMRRFVKAATASYAS